MENSAPMMDYGSPYATPSPAYYSGPISSAGCFGAGMGMASGPMTYQGMPSGQGLQSAPDSMIPNPNLPNNGAPFAPPMVPPPDVRDERFYMKNQLPQPGSAASSRATVIVKLPTDAKLFAEGRPLTLTSAERSFVTPELPNGREYSYTFRVEYERGGRKLSETQKINVQAGKTANLEFNDLIIGAAPKTNNNSTSTATVKSGAYPTSKPTAPVTVPSSERARITVKVPENATLYIDNKKNESNGTVREFTTPVVPAGRDFSYTMALETMKDGRPEQLTQKVIFRAGEMVSVDLTTPANAADRRASK